MSRPADVALLLRWCDLALEGLGNAREEIDALNVYPVPDGDTGTNLYLTFEAARQAIVDAEPQTLVSALTVFGRGALLGARGNSGVIMSQLLRAGADQLLRGDPFEPGRLLADTLVLAADAAYDAVAEPVEGTMLTVARAAATAASEAADADDLPDDLAAQMGHVITAAAKTARQALARTPDQLEILRLAGVVDAGGRGLCVLFDAAEQAITGRRAPAIATRRPSPLPTPLPREAGEDLSADGPSYEVMYLLDADDGAIAALRKRLVGLGDSLVVVGGAGLWNVHVHVDDVGAAIEAGMEAGRPHRVRVTHFAEQLARATARRAGARRGVIAVAAGEGLAGLFADAGAFVVSSAPGRRSSTGEILAAIRSAGSDEVVVLPNDPHTLAAAEAAGQAARDDGIRAAVIPTRAQVQGLAAIAVHDPSRSFDDDVVHMTSAAGHARHGAVTIAARDAMTTAGPCKAGDALGVVEGDFTVVGHDLYETAVTVADRLLVGGGELVTLVRGEAETDGLADRLQHYVEQRYAGVDVACFDGGQARYPLLIGVE